MSNRIQSDKKFRRLYGIIKEVSNDLKVKQGTATNYMSHFIKWQVDSLNKMETQEWLWSNFGCIYVDKKYQKRYDQIKEIEGKKREKKDKSYVVAANEELLQQEQDGESSEKNNNINNNN